MDCSAIHRSQGKGAEKPKHTYIKERDLRIFFYTLDMMWYRGLENPKGTYMSSSVVIFENLVTI